MEASQGVLLVQQTDCSVIAEFCVFVYSNCNEG